MLDWAFQGRYSLVALDALLDFPRGTIYDNQKGTSKYITSMKIAQKN
jgi:hypothetical protein